MTVSAGRQLRDAAAAGTLQVPGAFNALAARMIEQAGFPAAYLSGAAFSAGALALPDVGLFTLTELVQQTTWLTRSVSIPLIVDADTGFGEAINVERAVRELEAAGAAAIQLEDQLLPKRCGHLSGKSLAEPEAMCSKIRAAVSARRNHDTVILARTDARGVIGMQAAIDRAKSYVDAGADWIFPEALASEEEFAQMAQALRGSGASPGDPSAGPILVANMTEFGKSPLLTRDRLSGLGYGAILYPVTLLRLAMKRVDLALATLASAGTQQTLIDDMQTRQELYDLLGYADYEARDRSHFQGGSPNPVTPKVTRG